MLQSKIETMLTLFPSFNGTSLEIHYWFKDESHSMDATVQNKCESEILGILKTIAAVFGEEILIETEPVGEGGLIRFFKIILKKSSKNPVATAMMVTLATTLIITPLGTGIIKLLDKTIENIYEDKEDKFLDKEKKKAEIENIKADTELKKQQLEKSSVIIKRRSNFYETLEKYPKVEKVSIVIQDDNKKPQADEYIIERKNFKQFILSSDELAPREINDVTIEIISPVLKKGNYKWRGVYNDSATSFNMKSNEFKSLVQTGAIEFKNGTTIKCLLELKIKLKNDGEEEVTEYNILRVNEYFDNNKPVETQEGVSYRKKQLAKKNQLALFPADTENIK